jgi:hypothetical protein
LEEADEGKVAPEGSQGDDAGLLKAKVPDSKTKLRWELWEECELRERTTSRRRCASSAES